jgi:UDP-N-acetylmuramate--alanine ligase
MRPLFGKYSNVHLVGVGGAGMSGLAKILAARGCRVTGTDRVDSPVLERLRRQGVGVQVGHDAQAVQGADLVVFSAAIAAGSEELAEAERLGIDLCGRAEFLGRLTAGYSTAAIAGTHGKTTTASMLAAILEKAEWRPSFLIGGTVNGEIQGAVGEGESFVVEADEFDRSFLQLQPASAVVTTVDAEHLDCYDDLDGVLAAFAQFVKLVPPQGQCLLGGDSDNLRSLRKAVGRPCLTFGRGANNDYRPASVKRRSWGCCFDLLFQGQSLGSIKLQIPGDHNVDNATAAAGLAHALGVAMEPIAAGLSGFVGVDRRFHLQGEVGGILIVDDYAHHPAEIDVALAAARRIRERVVAVFQPHLYSRTRDFLSEFAHALQAADLVVIADIYAARETPIAGVDAQGIVREMRAHGFEAVEHVSPMSEIASYLTTVCRRGDLVITLGAGDIDTVSNELLTTLSGVN